MEEQDVDRAHRPTRPRRVRLPVWAGTSLVVVGALVVVALLVGAVIGVVVLQFALAFALACGLGFAGPIHVVPLIVATVLGTAALLSLGLLMAGTLRAEATLGAANTREPMAMYLIAGVLYFLIGACSQALFLLAERYTGKGMRAQA